jgi:hypothetical protein
MSMCMPIDGSVGKIIEMDFDVIKVSSCSARDWPLLEKVAATGKPIVASTGGLTQDEVDDLVSYLDHRGCDFALMHCVSIYPTPDDTCNLANIAAFRERYPGRVIGWSTHENPADTVPVGVAAALGAEMFERHVGIATDAIKLNAYLLPGVWHRFWTETGCVFEEISTTFATMRSTSYRLRNERWRSTIGGRFQLIDQLRTANVPGE